MFENPRVFAIRAYLGAYDKMLTNIDDIIRKYGEKVP
jgi:hypothetical protein